MVTDEQAAAQTAQLKRIADALVELVGASNNGTLRLERLACSSEERTTLAAEAPHPAVRAVSPATTRRQK